MLVVSCWARPGFADDTSATFASVLAFIEHNFGLAPLGVNDMHVYSYANAFSYRRPRQTWSEEASGGTRRAAILL